MPLPRASGEGVFICEGLEEGLYLKRMSDRETEALDGEIRFLERLLHRMPSDVEVLKILAEAYTRVGRVREGLDLDLRLKEICPRDNVVHYNLACSLALANRLDEAFQALRKAVELGYADLEWMNADPDLSKLRSDPRYQSEILPAFRKEK